MARDGEPAQWIVPTTGAKTLPAVELLTGRGFVTGKSGSGKSNTASVIAEELLENNYNLLIVDPEGEYYGLKEKYELLHAGADEELCDVAVGPDNAEKLASIALERNMPVILDVSDFLDAEEAQALIANVVRELYQKEKTEQKPFLLMIEEMQEYLPQSGGKTDLAKLLERVAKRGRKRGLGMLGMSQRPSSVDKDFITQCDWMVWHRLTWQTDLDVVRKILGGDVAEEVEDLETGEGFLMTDWDDTVEKVQFKRKRTHDAGATPGLESYDRPDLKSVGADLVREIEGATAGQQVVDDAAAGEALEDADVDIDAVVEDIDVLGDQPDGAFPDEDADLESADRTELEAAIRQARRRNEILEDEVRELRSILEEAERSSASPTSAGPPAPVEETAGPPATSPSPASPRDVTPPRPTAPRRPADREGVSGNIVEFVEMLVYLGRTASYKLRMIGYRLRSRNHRG